jgi:hypothetical protein
MKTLFSLPKMLTLPTLLTPGCHLIWSPFGLFTLMAVIL